LDAVVVSAEKKEEDPKNIPASVTALSSKNVYEYRLWDAKELTAIVPNLYSANPGDGRNVFSVRGITSTSYDPSVATYIDGVNQFTLDTYIPQLFDVERIEVLRGPQGTLYGRNAMGGVINIITKQPGNKAEAFLEISTGNYGMRRYSAGVKVPIVRDKLYLGAAGLHERLDGYYTNQFYNSSFDKQSTTGGNYFLKYLPSSTWELSMNVKHFSNLNEGAFPLVMGLDQAFNEPFSLNQNAVGQLVDYVFNGSFSVKHFAKLFSISSQTSFQSNYRYYDAPIDGDFSPIDGITIINDYGSAWNNVKVFTEELKFSSPAGSLSNLQWTAGLYFFLHDAPNKQATHFGEDAPLVGSPSKNYSVINTTDVKNEGGALYGQANYKLNKKSEIIFGLRYDNQHTKQRVLGEYQPDSIQAPSFETQPDTTTSVSFSAFSPKLGIIYHIASNSDIYASYTRGFRTGGLTQLSLDPSQPPLYPYKPEYNNSFEVGMKNTLFNNQVRANIALFYTSVSDAQVPTLLIPDAITVTQNAGDLNSKGIEIETMAIPVKGLEATYNLGYTHATYSKLKLSQNGNEVDMKGNRQVFTPDVTSMFALQYSLNLGKATFVRIVARAEWMYLGTTYFDLANTIRQAPHHLLNSRIGVSIKHLDVYFWARNLTDTRYVSYAYDFGGIHLGNPKTYGITVRGVL
ncbi:MAG TPA: TonB-dependent receptor, partial [Chitinophagaceae bacterium]|nr:TonB-dependent receptor [Chitinophagaceae bacterium]